MTWKLTWPILIDVNNLCDREGMRLSPRAAASALRDLADHIIQNPESLRKIFGEAVNAEVEDRWVLRPLAQANLAQAPDGGTYSGGPDGLPASWTVSSDWILAKGHHPDPGMVWSRPENLFGLPVVATFEDAAGQDIGRIDLRDWMAWSGDLDILEAIRCGWDFSAAARLAEEDTEAFGRPEPDPLSDDANFHLARARGWSRLVVLEKDRPRALSFLAELRPGLVVTEPAEPDASPGI